MDIRNKIRKLNTDSRGMTLIELIVGMAILTFVILGAMVLMISGSTTSGNITARVNLDMRAQTAFSHINEEAINTDCGILLINGTSGDMKDLILIDKNTGGSSGTYEARIYYYNKDSNYRHSKILYAVGTYNMVNDNMVSDLENKAKTGNHVLVRGVSELKAETDPALNSGSGTSSAPASYDRIRQLNIKMSLRDSGKYYEGKETVSFRNNIKGAADAGTLNTALTS